MRIDKNKYKERDPKETIAKCKRIVESLGLELVIEKHKTEVESHWCKVKVYYNGVFVTMSGGKGNTEEYALASGLAEVLERLQCENIYVYKQLYAYYNKDISVFENKFVRYPDDIKILDREEYKQKDIIFNKIRELEKDTEYLNILETIIDNNIKVTFDTFGFAPMTRYKEALTNEEVFINDIFFREYIYGSNGFCSGNSKYEALLQGLCEIVERYAKYIAYRDNLCLPIIDKSTIKQYDYSYSVIQKIEENGRYEIEVRDASLGNSLPVVSIILFDRLRRGYAVSYGSFPDFEIALERSLNELLQYKDIDNVYIVEHYRNYNAYSLNMTDFEVDNNKIAFKEGADAYWIFLNNRGGRGLCKDRFFSNEFDYSYIPWDTPYGKSNEEMFYDTCKLIKEKLGDDVIYKDFSYLGFNSYAVVCLNLAIEEFIRTKKYVTKQVFHRENIEENIFGWGEITAEDVEKYSLGDKSEFAIELVLGKPTKFDRDTQSHIYEGFIEFVKGNYSKSASLFMRNIPFEYSNGVALTNNELDYWWCLTNYIGLMENHKDTRTIKTILNKFYNKHVVEKIEEFTRSNGSLADAMFRDRFSEICVVDWDRFMASSELHKKLSRLKDEYFKRAEK